MAHIAVFLLAVMAITVVEQGLVLVVRLWNAGRNAEEVLQRVEVLGREGRIDEAQRMAKLLPGSVSTVVTAGLGRPDAALAESAMNEAAAGELTRFPVQLIDWAGVGALVVPLAFGAWLLGTGRLDQELGGWLLLVAWGLGTAILAVLIRFWVLSRRRRLAVEMEKGALVVYNTAR